MGKRQTEKNKWWKRQTEKNKWDKDKGAKGYLRLIVDDAGVVGVLRRDVRCWFVRVPSEGGLDGGSGQCAGG